MTPLHQLNVDLGDRSYPIFIGNQLLENHQLITDYIVGNSALIVTNTTVAPLYLAKIEAALSSSKIRFDTLILPDGEQYKTLENVERIIDVLIDKRHDRKVTLIALGGGVIGDITGFAAAIYQRGVNFIQIPTTLLSQVDSSVGGKTGVNHPRGKNMIGAFYQPQCVIADTGTLSTLPERELSAGMAEVIKYGLIHNAEFFSWLEENILQLMQQDYELLSEAILTSCRIKAEVVAIDEKESGIRAILNLGHTFGHAIESAMGYGNWLHGEAVAAGMIMAIDLSQRHGWVEQDLMSRATALLTQAKLPVTPPQTMTMDQYLNIMAIDKKVDQGVIKLVLLNQLGNAVITGDYDIELLYQTLQHF